MATVNRSKQNVNFEIMDMVTVPRAEYEQLKRRAESADKIVMTIADSQRSLNRSLRNIGRECMEVKV